jgi:ring-1,2-phenylacetyl-CoA epoxidase subunit PaaC
MTTPMNDVFALADDKLMLGHTQSDWTGLGPILEEDIAASAMAQDDLSHALVLYEFLGEDPDELAFDRAAGAYRCCDLVTVPDAFDWAVATVRRFFYAHFAAILLDRFMQDERIELAARAKRLQLEQTVQTTHLTAWMIRLGNGSDDANSRMQAAIDLLSMHAGMMFEDINDRQMAFNLWNAATAPVIEQACLTCAVSLPDDAITGGRRGAHAAHFVEQHAEMTQVRSAEPNASW